MVAEIDALPDLFLAALEQPERFRFLRAETGAAVGAEHFNEPRVGFSGREPFHLQSHRHFLAVDEHFGVQHRVVPRVARRDAAFAVGALRVNFLQLRVNAERLPAEAKRHVDDVHAKVAHHADLAAGFDLALPIDRLVGVEIARVPETGADFQDATELA